MSRQDIESEIEREFGFVPQWMQDMPDSVLEQYWSTTKWILGDSTLSARDKALVAFGAATAIHCPY
jgi:alkylhydroperoxidase/carboxymuconolactone decarboxylase family protein YurZ